MDTILESMMGRFQTICNYQAKTGLNEATLLSDVLTSEEGDSDPNAGGAPEGGDDAMGGGMPGGDPNAMGGAPAGDPNAMGGAPIGGGMPGGDPNAMGGAPAGDPNAMGGDPNAGAAQGPEGFNPQIDMNGAPDMSGNPADMGGGMDSDDDVVDVTELTDKQDEMEKELSKESDKFDKLFKLVGQFSELVRSNNEKIDDLKAEYEKRNPTQVEKLSMQTDKSYPFTVTPEEYWKEKTATSNYSTENDNNGKDQGQYVITKKDVDGDINWMDIAKSLDDPDFKFGMTLDKLARF